MPLKRPMPQLFGLQVPNPQSEWSLSPSGMQESPFQNGFALCSDHVRYASTLVFMNVSRVAEAYGCVYIELWNIRRP